MSMSALILLSVCPSDDDHYLLNLSISSYMIGYANFSYVLVTRMSFRLGFLLFTYVLVNLLYL